MALDEVLLEKNNERITKIILRNSIFEFEDDKKLFHKFQNICKSIVLDSRILFDLQREIIEEDLFEIYETVTDKDFTTTFTYEIADAVQYLKGEVSYIKDYISKTSSIISTNIFFNPLVEAILYDDNYNETYASEYLFTNKEFLKNIKSYYREIYNIDLIQEPRFKKMMKFYSKSKLNLKELEETIISYYEPKTKFKIIVDNTKNKRKKI